VHTAKVRQIRTDEIAPNPHNPRRLFDEEPMQILTESVRKLGILVPLTLYEAPPKHLPKKEHYILLDGERRWRCGAQLGMSSLPAIVVDRPTETENILTMFHIHNVREGWQLMPTALKLKVLMDELREPMSGSSRNSQSYRWPKSAVARFFLAIQNASRT
jgi:ParB family chromosome partitioning protein